MTENANSREERQLRSARQALDEAQSRLTPQRKAVLKALLANPTSHQSADEVLQAARQIIPDLGLATVYRTLELFSRLGIVRRLDTAEGQSRFEYNTEKDDEHYHHHVICLDCGRISEFNEDMLEDIEERAEAKTGYKVIDHCLQLYGYCPDCMKKSQNKDKDKD
ncbi:MAG TPA: transcriptional repressor [Firmicutes bacterium]|nr:transcriptional repressor [Bacillota bacterium]